MDGGGGEGEALGAAGGEGEERRGGGVEGGAGVCEMTFPPLVSKSRSEPAGKSKSAESGWPSASHLKLGRERRLEALYWGGAEKSSGEAKPEPGVKFGSSHSSSSSPSSKSSSSSSLLS